MFPLHDDNPTRSAPALTIALIAANVLVFLYQISLGLDFSAFAYGLVPAELMQGADHLYAGRRLGLPPGTGVRNLDPAALTVLTSMFMHGGWLHLIGNMWYLWLFGNNIEDALGRARFPVFYLTCGGLAALSQVLLSPASLVPMVGASGAVAGILGAYLVTFPGSRVTTLVTLGFFWQTVQIPAGIVLGFWFVLQFVSGLGALGLPANTGGVAYAAHVGGFVAGMVLIRLFGATGRPPRRRQSREVDTFDWR